MNQAGYHSIVVVGVVNMISSYLFIVFKYGQKQCSISQAGKQEIRIIKNRRSFVARENCYNDEKTKDKKQGTSKDSPFQQIIDTYEQCDQNSCIAYFPQMRKIFFMLLGDVQILKVLICECQSILVHKILFIQYIICYCYMNSIPLQMNMNAQMDNPHERLQVEEDDSEEEEDENMLKENYSQLSSSQNSIKIYDLISIMANTHQPLPEYDVGQLAYSCCSGKHPYLFNYPLKVTLTYSAHQSSNRILYKLITVHPHPFFMLPQPNTTLMYTYSAIIYQFLYLYVLTYQQNLHLNGERKALLNYIIQNDDVYLFRFISKYEQVVNFIEEIIDADAVECFKHYRSLYLKKQAFTLKVQPRKKIASSQSKWFKSCLSILDCHNHDTKSHLTVYFLLILLISLLMFCFSKVYIECNMVIYDFSLIMGGFYWFFSEVWFLNQTIDYNSKKSQNKLKNFIPQNASMIDAFNDYYNRGPDEQQIFNWYQEDKQVQNFSEEDQFEIKRQWKKSEGLMKMLRKEINNEIQDDQQEIDLLSTVVYLVENEKIDQLKGLEFSKWCPTCLSYKQNGTKHCSICNRCVPYYSHHSLVYNRCIFQQNQFFFLMTFLCQWIVTALYLLRIFHFYIIRTQSLNPLTLIQEIIKIDEELWLIFYSLIFLDFIVNTRFFYYEVKGISLNLTQNELKNISRYKYINLANRRPQGIVNNFINFVADRVTNAKLI